MMALDTLPLERILEQGTPLMASGGQAHYTSHCTRLHDKTRKSTYRKILPPYVASSLMSYALRAGV